jgi:hypothetical protein
MDTDKKAALDPRKIMSIDEGLAQSHLNTVVKDTVIVRHRMAVWVASHLSG